MERAVNEKSLDRGVLGKLLFDLREAKRMTLREVEEASEGNVSNAYLSQIETGKIEKPSPHILHQLARVYNVSYETLMEKAGYVIRDQQSDTRKAKRRGRVPTFAVDDLTEEEEAQLLEYLAFLRSRKGRK